MQDKNTVIRVITVKEFDERRAELSLSPTSEALAAPEC